MMIWSPSFHLHAILQRIDHTLIEVAAAIALFNVACISIGAGAAVAFVVGRIWKH